MKHSSAFQIQVILSPQTFTAFNVLGFHQAKSTYDPPGLGCNLLLQKLNLCGLDRRLTAKHIIFFLWSSSSKVREVMTLSWQELPQRSPVGRGRGSTSSSGELAEEVKALFCNRRHLAQVECIYRINITGNAFLLFAFSCAICFSRQSPWLLVLEFLITLEDINS